MDQNGSKRDLAILLVVCMVLRLAMVFGLGKYPAKFPLDGYDQIAENLIVGKGFAPTRPFTHIEVKCPTYPLLLAAVWKVVPPSAPDVPLDSPSYLAVELVQVGLSVATCWLIYGLGGMVFGRRVGLVAAGLFALSPSWIVMCSLIYVENPQIFFVALAAFLAAKLAGSARPWIGLVLGLTWGAASLNRPESTWLFPILGLPFLLAKGLKVSQKLKAGSATALGLVVVMLPWVVRNFLIYGTLVLHVPVSGWVLCASMWPHPPYYGNFYGGGSAGSFSSPDSVFRSREYLECTEPYCDKQMLADRKFDYYWDERDLFKANQKLAALAKSNVLNYKSIQVQNMLKHAVDLWTRPAGWYIPPSLRLGDKVSLPSPLKLAWFGGYLAFLGAVVGGVVVSWKAGKLGAVPRSWLLLVAAHAGLMLLVDPDPRYQVNSAPFLYLFAAVGLARFAPSSRPDRTEQGPATGSRA